MREYYKDKPQIDEQYDLLGYTKFLDQVFTYVEHFLLETESNIIGFAANWGDGKTTTMNFLKERIKERYTGFSFNNLTLNFRYLFNLIIRVSKFFIFYFFLILLTGMSICTIFNKDLQIIILLWIIFVVLIIAIPKFAVLWSKFTQILKSVFLKKEYILLDFESWASKDENQVIEQFLKTLSGQIDLAGGADDFNKYIKAILKYKNIDLDLFYSDESLSELYQRLKVSLENSNKKIIVFIDDMDRMTGKEIFCLLKLVKVVASFPNTLYILAYNKDYVARELTQVISYKPEEYLEKIITNEYRLPNIKTEQISELLMAEIEKIIGPDTDNYDRKNINIILDSIISYYIPNLRKAYRVLNAFVFHYKLFFKANVLINIEDLLSLTILKVFNLDLYNRLWNERKNIFENYFIDSEEKKKYEEKYIVGYIERDSLSPEETIIINRLFNNSDILKYDVKRIKDANHFDLYFSYEVEESQILKIKDWLLNFSPENPQKPDFEYNSTMTSDLNDLMYSKLYYQHRNTNFAIGLIELMINYPELAKNVYIKDFKSYFNNFHENFINNMNMIEIVSFIDKNKSHCEINLLEWLLFDSLFYDGTSSLTPLNKLTDELEKIKISIQDELQKKLKECNIREIYSFHTIQRLSLTYKFNDIIKDKFLKFLHENDEEVVSMLQQFTSIGYSSSVGEFYNLYIIEKICELGLASEYKERLQKIQQNVSIMKNTEFINYYCAYKEFNDGNKKHIVDKSIEIIEKTLKSENNKIE